jgi:predicted transcriptional regulator
LVVDNFNMNIAIAKVDLAKKILDTESEELITYISSIFESQKDNWFNELPEEIQASVEKGMKQSELGQTLPHAEVMEKYKKWQKK